ncbi:metalloregulator ArsR/SmtB family transcription factor [Sedimenticola sp.]|uniref:metalloregulator ArsR/SmtB family transcription factor n=1 Tax=Sedimenticola sp. TaxID=1940285 RepID=UPI003D0FB6F3
MKLDPNQLLSALADQTRLRVVNLLSHAGELCVCDLVSALESHQPKISRHLKTLRDTGLINARRDGTWMHYRMNPELPTWSSQAITHLLNGCETKKPYTDDRRRLAETAGTTCCN